MRFRTIWSLRGLPLRERLARTRDWAAMTIGAKLPLRIRFWIAIQETGYAVRNSKNIPATPFDEVLKNLRTPANLS